MASDAVVDFQAYGLDVKDSMQVNAETVKTLGKQIIDAFKRYNFCYLKNHGVLANLLEEYMAVSRDFFDQSYEFKSKIPLGSDYRFGWMEYERERLNPKRISGDLHEAFNYSATYDTAWPPVEKFEVLSKEFYAAGEALGMRVGDALSLGLDLPIDYMRNANKLVGQRGNSSCVRTLYYPPIPSDKTIGDDQVRMGEHTDTGIVTLNFQDQTGGLEVKNPEGEFVMVEPIPGTVVVTVNDSLQRWTSGFLSATLHRLPLPNDERRYKARQALLFFLLPDDDYVYANQPNESTREHLDDRIREGIYTPKE